MTQLSGARTISGVIKLEEEPVRTLAFAVVTVLACAGSALANTTTTLHLTEKQTFQHYLDKGARGESRGDIRTFGGPVFAAGKRVGHDQIRCVVGSTCSETIWLPGGTLHADHVVVRPPKFTAAVTRGTGRYAGVHGTAAIELGKVSRYTITLSR